MWRISSKLTYANVTATVALFAALGGGAYAATSFVTSNGVVKLCVSRNGAVKVLGAKKNKCGRGTALVAVNQQGPAGRPGPPGTGSALTYSAGSGLTLSGTSFSADPTKLQARIAGSGCASDQALQSVAQDGTPACTGLHAHSAKAGTANYLQNNTATVVPAGTWLLLGQAEAATSGADSVTCLLQVNSQTVDSIVQALPANSNYTISPIVTTTTTGPSNVVQILCTAGSGSTIIGGNLTIVAIPLAALN
ncbi:MAG TPA: hypothetical protein VGH24_03840 [Solirubrobacteraceae bacterium]